VEFCDRGWFGSVRSLEFGFIVNMIFLSVLGLQGEANARITVEQNHEPKVFWFRFRGYHSSFGLSSKASAGFRQELSALAFAINFYIITVFWSGSRSEHRISCNCSSVILLPPTFASSRCGGRGFFFRERPPSS
jgi:hypothetical protein